MPRLVAGMDSSLFLLLTIGTLITRIFCAPERTLPLTRQLVMFLLVEDARPKAGAAAGRYAEPTLFDGVGRSR